MKTTILVKRKSTLFLLFILTNFSFAIVAQQKTGLTGEIKGKLSSKAQMPIEFATVSLYHEDSSIVTGALSDTTGKYIFAEIPAGKYYVVVRHLEYSTFKTPLINLKAGESKEIEDITLEVRAINLSAVEVIARKPVYEVQADKIVFNVEASPSASGTNGLELLKISPGVTLDMDNNVSLLGKGGVQIYINGRPSRLSGTDLAMMLQNLTSDNIASIEVISNPSSKYDADGNAGIINIKIKKNLAFGLNGVATMAGSKGNFYRSNAGVTLNYGGEKIRAFGRINRNQNDIQDDVIDSKNQNGFFIDSRSFEVQRGDGYNIDFGLETQLNEKHSLDFSVMSILNDNDNQLNSTTEINRRRNELEQILDSKTNLIQSANNYNSGLNHRWAISSSENLSTDLSYGNYQTTSNTSQPNTFFAPDGERVLSVQNTRFDAETGINLFSIQSDYEKSWKKIKLSTGAKYGVIETDNLFNFFNIPNAEPVLDITKSNQFIYSEKVFALYAASNIELNKRYKLNIGLRMENTNSRGQLITTLNVDNKDVPRNYTDFFPNLGLSFNDQKTHAWSLSLGRRITRPSYQSLNPFITPRSQLLVWEGNPFLQPNYSMNYQFTYTLKQSLTITNSYSVTKDFFATIIEIVGENGNRIIPRNMQNSTNYGLSISYPLKVNKWWNITTLFNGSHSTFDGDLEGTVIDISITNYSINIQNNFKLPLGINMDLNYLRFSDLIWRGSILIQGFQGLNFGLRKEFFEKKLQVNFTGNDIFRTNSDYFYGGNYGGIILDGVRSFDNRRYGLSASLKFGNQKVKTRSKSKNGLDEELKRLRTTD